MGGNSRTQAVEGVCVCFGEQEVVLGEHFARKLNTLMDKKSPFTP